MEAWRIRQKIPAAVDPVEANALRGGRMSLRDSFIVGMQTLISNSVGASVGLEAGFAQIGSGLGSFLGQKLRLRRSDLRDPFLSDHTAHRPLPCRIQSRANHPPHFFLKILPRPR